MQIPNLVPSTQLLQEPVIAPELRGPQCEAPDICSWHKHDHLSWHNFATRDSDKFGGGGHCESQTAKNSCQTARYASHRLI